MNSALQLLIKEFSEFRKEMRTALSQVNQRLDSIDTTLKPLTQAVDKDAETIVQHGRRISRIEKQFRR